jgi:hypothetical protein
MKAPYLVITAVTSLLMVGLAAVPANAAPPTPVTPPSSQQAELNQWTAVGAGTGGAIGSSSALGARVATAATAVKGYDYKYYRGSVFVWTQDELEWYYTPTAITSASGSQTCGYIFPNTCKNNGITRTYNTAAQQNWSGKNTVGIGTVTPWGAVNIASSTKVDKYQIYPNTHIVVIPG